MSFKKNFQKAWLARFPSGVDGVKVSAPTLNCCDSYGRLVSQEALRGELDRCRQRIAELQQSIVEQEFIENYCLGHLDSAESNGPMKNSKQNGSVQLVAKRSLTDEVDRVKAEGIQIQKGIAKARSIESLKCTRKESNSSVDSVRSDIGPSTPKIEDAYATPADVNLDSAESRHSCAESLYSEPVDVVLQHAKQQQHAEELYLNASEYDARSLSRKSSNGSIADPPSSTNSPGVRRTKRTNYENISEVQDPNGDGGSSEGEDDSMANLLAIRQSVSRLSHWCQDGSVTRLKLELQAQRLSNRFSGMYGGGSGGGNSTDGGGNGGPVGLAWSNRLEPLQESLMSPSTPSAPMDLLGGSVGMDADSMWPVIPGILDPHDHSDSKPPPDVVGGGTSSPVVPPSGPLDMRQWIVTTLLTGERSYVVTLGALLELKESLRSLLGSSTVDLEATYSGIQQLYDAHKQFVNELSLKVASWSPEQSIGEIMKILAMHEYAIAPDYLRNYQRVLTVVTRCRQENTNFDDIIRAQQTSDDRSSLEEMLQKPVIRFERNTLVLHDLIKYTPTGHADYDLLQKTLKLARRFLDNLEAPELERDNPEFQRYLVKHGLIVEKVGKDRKLRHVFLFNDVIVTAKQKIAKSQKDQYEVKWFIPLTDLSLGDRLLAEEDMRMAEDHKQEVEAMQKKVSESQAEYKMELKKNKESDKPKLLRKNKSLDRIRKKLLDQEVALVIAMPHLQFRVHNQKQHKQYLLMMSSDYERSDWRDTIKGLLQKAFIVSQYCSSVTLSEVQNLLGRQKVLTKSSSIDRDSISMEEDRLYGSLHVLVNKLQGLKQSTKGTFCRIEVDSFGHFLMKAKTNVSPANKPPMWNERFEVDLDGAQTLRVLCYSQDRSVDTLLGKGAIELGGMWLKDEFQEVTITLSHDLSLSVSLKYLSHSQTIQRCSAKIAGQPGVLFGASLAEITKRESRSIPLLVTSCIQEIESRGMTDEGLYRISGLAIEIDELKDEFEKNPTNAGRKVKSADVNVLTSLVKMFFRGLPDPLFTEALYTRFAEGIGLADPDAKDSCLLALVRRLPQPNFCTAVFLLDHLIKVSKLENRNKMGLRNLATVFGPTLLRPANRNSQPKTMEQLFFLAAHEVTIQTTVLYQLLVMKSNGAEFDPLPPPVTAF